MRMRRDKRLLVALLSFLTALVACAVQVEITALYIDAAVLGGWTWFAKTFSVEVPGSGPGEFCFDYCAPALPFFAGWIALAGFLFGWVVLFHAWWSPRDPVAVHG
jgi:hypothetical protein